MARTVDQLPPALVVNPTDRLLVSQAGIAKRADQSQVAAGGAGITQLTGDVLAGPGAGAQAASVVKVQGFPWDTTAPAPGDVPTWDGAQYTPQQPYIPPTSPFISQTFTGATGTLVVGTGGGMVRSIPPPGGQVLTLPPATDGLVFFVAKAAGAAGDGISLAPDGSDTIEYLNANFELPGSLRLVFGAGVRSRTIGWVVFVNGSNNWAVLSVDSGLPIYHYAANDTLPDFQDMTVTVDLSAGSFSLALPTSASVTNAGRRIRVIQSVFPSFVDSLTLTRVPGILINGVNADLVFFPGSPFSAIELIQLLTGDWWANITY
jgi:hypothetical protein